MGFSQPLVLNLVILLVPFYKQVEYTAAFVAMNGVYFIFPLVKGSIKWWGAVWWVINEAFCRLISLNYIMQLALLPPIKTISKLDFACDALENARQKKILRNLKKPNVKYDLKHKPHLMRTFEAISICLCFTDSLLQIYLCIAADKKLVPPDSKPMFDVCLCKLIKESWLIAVIAGLLFILQLKVRPGMPLFFTVYIYPFQS